MMKVQSLKRKIGVLTGIGLLFMGLVFAGIPLKASASKDFSTGADDSMGPQIEPISTLGIRDKTGYQFAKPDDLGVLDSPGYYETSEYLIGSVAFAVIPLESNGAIDLQKENWNDGGVSEIGTVRTEIKTALDWWSGQNPNASVSFRGHPRPDFAWRVHQPVPISYEPITRPSTDEGLWIGEAMTYLGFPGTDYYAQTIAYLNSLRSSFGPDWGSEADWAFVIFMVDSSNYTEGNGCFTDGAFAYAYLGGPFIVMTYTNNGYGSDDLDRTAAHEIGHIFYATDENDGINEYSGYLNACDVENSGGVMYGYGAFGWFLSSGTQGQVGWRDSDGDGIQDIVDTFPDTVLTSYSPDPTTDSSLTYTGAVLEIPYPNSNPYGPSRDITINRITNVEFRVDDEPWMNATAVDGAFNATEEAFYFTTDPLPPGPHTVETRGINSVGNVETTYASDTVTIIGSNIRVDGIVPLKTVINQGYNFNVTVDVANTGTYSETFNITVFLNITSVSSQSVTLASQTYAIFNITCDTADLAQGNYTLIAVADTVPSETYLADNEVTDGWIGITILGDLTPEFGVIDIFDITVVAIAFNSQPADPNWNAHADINNDGLVDIFDIVVVALHFGETE